MYIENGRIKRLKLIRKFIIIQLLIAIGKCMLFAGPAIFRSRLDQKNPPWVKWLMFIEYQNWRQYEDKA